MSGFITLNRKLFEHPLWTEERTYSKGEAWIDMIQLARFEPSAIVVNSNVIDVQRGEVCASLRFLSNRWNWSTKKVSTYLKLLVKLRMIETQKKQGVTVLKLLNYDTYNGGGNAGETPKKQKGNSKETPRKQQGNKNKESKEREEGEECKKKKPDYKKCLLSELENSDFDNPEYFEITISFWELFKKNLEDSGVSTNQVLRANGKWIDQIRLMIESDGYTTEDMRTVFKFLQYDNFWKTNILSTDKLRKQFDKLLMQAKNRKNGNSKKREPATSNEQLIGILSKHFD